ncbi:MAG TPA: hypothetical protein VMY39_10050 [Planctomycetota bacterium]|nr:hypothetical protein [Planctomycetota bacterium]
MRTSREVLLVCSLVACLATMCHARLRWDVEDDELVTRSELIVVGHIAEGSVRFLPHDVAPDEGRSWEHHATLVVTGTIKGEAPGKEIPIVLHYGLDPSIGGKMLRDEHLRAVEPRPVGAIRIVDTAASGFGGHHAVEDARKDAIWFLRKGTGIRNRRIAPDRFGIVDPEELQPLALRKYFEVYLAADPERGVRDYLANHPELHKRAQRYLDRREIERIVRLPDARERLTKLMPYFDKHDTLLWWRTQDEARRGIETCGDLAGAALADIFDKADSPKRQWIIRMWGRIRYRDAVGPLLDLIAAGEKFWDGYDVKQGWWNDDRRPLWSESRRRWSEMHYAVETLKSIDDPRSDAVEKRVGARLKRLAELMPRDPNDPDPPAHTP